MRRACLTRLRPAAAAAAAAYVVFYTGLLRGKGKAAGGGPGPLPPSPTSQCPARDFFFWNGLVDNGTWWTLLDVNVNTSFIA